ncbi:hypothetical protein NIB75_24625 [Bacteroides uniformis]|nr:hypothetical protein [Bacteroides uniformis]
MLLLAGLAAQARKELLSITCVRPLRCALPLQGDSINFKGDKFTTGNLLKTKVSLDFDGGRYERMVADTAGYVTVAKGGQGQSVLSVCYQSACGAFHEGQAECIFSCPF